MSDGVVQYRFLSVVGEGGFGRVYRARMEAQEGFSKEVAIKVLSDPSPPKSLLERFRDEARILALIRDRAIVGVEPPVRIGDRWAVVMDFVDGCSCGTMLERGPMPAGVSVEIVSEVARALHSAYNQEGPEGNPLQLLHRDIKPENIQITPSGGVRVLDFGIAKANFAAREFKTRHALGGTPGYIAPERLQRVEVHRGDVFSLGVVLHELVTCERPTFPPTINLETVDQSIDYASDVALDDEDLLIDARLKGDPHVMEVLQLAAWMRANDPDQRPTARQVEEACRDLRRRMTGPYFRDWAEQHVPHRIEIASDAMVGEVLVTHGGIADVRSGWVPPAANSEPQTGVTAAPITGSTTTGTTGTQGLALGAMLGGGVALALSGLAVLVLASGMGVFLYLQRGRVAQTEVRPGVAPEAGQTEAPAPQVTAPNTNAPPEAGEEDPPQVVEAPRPNTSPPPVDRPPRRHIVTLPSPTARPSEPETYTPSFPTQKAATGTLVLRTKPRGASVLERGTVLRPVSTDHYELPVGMHKITVRHGDEEHMLPVKVVEGEKVDVCFDFDTDRKCGL